MLCCTPNCTSDPYVVAKCPTSVWDGQKTIYRLRKLAITAAIASTTSCWVMLVDIHTTTELPTRLRCPIAASIAPLVLASQLGFTWGETRFRITPSSTLEIRSVCLCFSLGVACVLPPRIDRWDASDDLLSVAGLSKAKKNLV